MPTAAEVIEKVLTTANPASGSLPPPEIAWAVFTNGTVFFSAPGDELSAAASADEIAAAAHAALRDLGPVRPGGPGGDFTVSRLDGWYPDDPVWFVGFGVPTIAAVVVGDFDADVVAGLTGRAARDRDHASPHLLTVRTFGGDRITHPPAGR